MKTADANLTAAARLERMRAMFEHDMTVLAEDYAHFTQPPDVAQSDAPTRPSKAAHTSAARPGKRRPKSS